MRSSEQNSGRSKKRASLLENVENFAQRGGRGERDRNWWERIHLEADENKRRTGRSLTRSGNQSRKMGMGDEVFFSDNEYGAETGERLMGRDRKSHVMV